MAFTASMSGGRRWCPVVFGGHNIFTAARWYSHTSSATPAHASFDDEPPPADAEGNGLLVLRAHCEYPSAILNPNDAARDGVAVMVTVKAPTSVAADSRRTPVDLVAILDVGGSMAAGAKLEHVKRAMAFVIDSLGPGDRLSVVAFGSGGARRVTRLTRMSEDGKAAAKRAVDSLAAAAGGGGSGPANVRGGLDEAAKVLCESRHDNDIAAVILVSDGQGSGPIMTSDDDHSGLVPPFLTDSSCCGRRPTPVHAFVLGSDDDHGGTASAAAMHHVSEVTGGTFSFVESHHASVQDALARCAGGILSVAAEGVCVSVECARLKAVKSGRYKIYDMDKPPSRDVMVSLGDLYADEERRFLLVFDDAQRAGRRDANHLVSKLTCNYLDTATGQMVDVYEAADVSPDMEVNRELLRVAVAERMALARAAAERGEYAEAARILDVRRESLGLSVPELAAELRNLSLRVADEREYRRTGRARLLAGISAHAQQRGSAMFATPAMRKMEKLSEMLRERQQQAAALAPENRSRAVVVPRSRLEARLAAAAPRLSMLRRYRRLLPLRR